MTSAKAAGAGAFVLAGVLLFTAVIFTIGDRRRLFEPRFPVSMTVAHLGQLRAGAVVRVEGVDAGSVTAIDVPREPGDPFEVRMRVRDDLRHLVRTDSIASIQTEGFVGAVFVNIGAGTRGAPPVADGETIAGRPPVLIADVLAQAGETIGTTRQTILALREELERTIQAATQTVGELHGLVEDLRPEVLDATQRGGRVVANAESMVTTVAEGQGTIGRLIHDETLYHRIRGIADEVDAVVGNIREISDEARRTIAGFGGPDGPTQAMVADMRATLREAREATAALADNMDALRHNFLLRGFFNRRGYFDLNAISPLEYRAGLLEDSGRRALRIWLDASVIFDPGPGGAEQLSDGGRARVDAAMATYLPYLPTGPVVVEGYATSGTAAERYHQSQVRARTVREYLLDRYRLRPQHTAYIGLADEAEESPVGGDRWDGIALTLVVNGDDLRPAP